MEEMSPEAVASAWETLDAFCRCWFTQRDPEATLAYMTQDVGFIGTGEEEFAQGRAAMAAYLRADIAELSEPFAFTLTPLHVQQIAAQACNLCAELTLRNDVYSWRLRGFFTLVREDGRWLLRSLHFAEPGRSQGSGEHYPKAMALREAAQQRQLLLDRFLPGGLLGGYLEEGVPFSFINQRMLHYLGYESEEEFVRAIDGKLCNCVHPEDWPPLEDALARALLHEQDGGEYSAESRLRRKDGSYFWVHNIGHRTVAEDGRPALNMLCIDITAQKQAQEELLSLYNNIPGAVFRCRFDADFSVLSANDGLFEFIGYTREEFAAMGNRMSAVIYPEDYAVMAGRLSAQLEQGNTIHNENRLVCKDGTVKWIAIKGQLIRADKGEPYFYCVFVDITEEKLLQERVRDLYEKELAYFARMSSAGGSVQGRINITQNRVESYEVTSDVAVGRVGDSYEDIIRNLAASAVEPAFARTLLAGLERETLLRQYAAGKWEYAYEFLRKSRGGRLFWSATSFRIQTHPQTGDAIMFFYTSDITERKVREQLLSRMAELEFDIVADIDITTDRYHMLTLEPDAKNVLPPDGLFQTEIRKLAEAYMDEQTAETYLSHLDYDYMRDRLSREEDYSFAIELGDGRGGRQTKRYKVFYIDESLGRACMARTDVTDVVRRELRQREDLAAALAAAEQANAAKSDFLSRMSHEIRTPMNAIIGMSAIAANAIGDDEQVADCISKIGISSRFLLSLINDILDMSRIESGKMLLKSERIPTEEFLNGINSICYAQAEAKGVEYECVIDPMLEASYTGDSMKLQQVLINILSNAVKFTDAGGKVTFSVQQRRRARGEAALRFTVNDTGVGMGEEFLPHIFEPFAQESTGITSAYGGTGLGLAISKSIVDMMGGRITVRSIKGVGSELTVDVKLKVNEEEAAHRPARQTYSFSHLKTLVVDDDVAVCESTVAILKEMGVKAEWLDSGAKAVERVRALWDEGRFFDMILIDWKMPEMDGIETARRIRRIVGPDVTIIIMTAYDWVAIEHEARLAGVNLLTSKPMFKSTLISAFSKALGEKEEHAVRPERAYDFTGKRVLLVEDNALNTEVATMLLRAKGFEVVCANNGLRALELFSKSRPGEFDVILMDIRMPLMDGLTAALNIRHLSNADAGSIPILAMTANAFDDDIEKSKAAGMNGHLAKPIEPQRLYQTLYDFIYGKEE